MPVRKIEALISVKTQGVENLTKITKKFNELGGKTALKTVRGIQKVTRETKILEGAFRKINPEVARLTKKFNTYGGEAALKATRETNRLKRAIKTLNPAVKKSTTVWTKFVKGIALGNIAAQAAVGAFNLMKKAVGDATRELADATKVAARIEVLNGVMQFTGQAAGYSARQLETNAKALQAQGITISESLGLQQRFIQANLDIALATDIATVAQNAAVIAGINSSEAALGLTDAIVKQRPILLKQFGIITSLDQIYNQAAASLGKTRDELTTTEKRMGFFNEIMKQASTITGAYATAMDFAGKRLTSLPRHFEAAQQAVGRHFLPAFNTAITVTEKLLKGIKEAFGDPIDLVQAASLKFENAATATMKLADRYDILAGKANLTAVEQEEINRLLATFASNSPEVVTAWDEQGKAIGVNTTKLRANLEAKRSLIAIEAEEALRELGEAFRIASIHIDNNRIALENSNRWFIEGSLTAEQYNEGLENSGTIINRLSGELDDMAFKAGAHFPNLVAGTERYKFAVSVLRKEFADLIVAAEAADVATKKVGGADTGDDTPPQVQTGIGFQGETIDLLAAIRKQQQARNKAAKEREQAAREHSGRMALVRGLEFETSLIGLDEFHVAVKEANLAHNERMIELQEGEILTRAEFNQGRLASEALLQEELSFIQLDAVEATAQAYEDRWMWATDATQEAFGELARIAVTDTTFIGRKMETVFEDIGRSIVVNMAKKAVDALQKYIFQAIAAKAVTKLLGNEQEDLGNSSQTLANISGNLAGQTLNVVTQTFLAVTAMKAEGVQVKTLIAHYIALAAAKSAVNPFSAPGRIAAAVAVQTTLTPMLMTGFDDPQNDRVAFRHGADYASEFMRGLNTEWKAPDYGQTIRQNIPIGGGGDYAQNNGYLSDDGGSGSVPGIVLNIHGNVYSNDDLIQIMIDGLQSRAIDFGVAGSFTRGNF